MAALVLRQVRRCEEISPTAASLCVCCDMPAGACGSIQAAPLPALESIVSCRLGISSVACLHVETKREPHAGGTAVLEPRLKRAAVVGGAPAARAALTVTARVPALQGGGNCKLKPTPRDARPKQHGAIARHGWGWWTRCGVWCCLASVVLLPEEDGACSPDICIMLSRWYSSRFIMTRCLTAMVPCKSEAGFQNEFTQQGCRMGAPIHISMAQAAAERFLV